jgi:hypothetical protein
MTAESTAASKDSKNGVPAAGEGVAPKENKTKKRARPRGRPPNGMVWDSETGTYTLAATLSSSSARGSEYTTLTSCHVILTGSIRTNTALRTNSAASLHAFHSA